MDKAQAYTFIIQCIKHGTEEDDKREWNERVNRLLQVEGWDLHGTTQVYMTKLGGMQLFQAFRK